MTYVLEDIRPTAFTVRLRDTATGATEEHPFAPGEPLPLGARAAAQADELVLRLHDAGGEAQVTALGARGEAWAQAKKTLLGQPWTRTPEGMMAFLQDSPTLLRDLGAEAPDARLDLAEYSSRHIRLHLETLPRGRVLVSVSGPSAAVWARFRTFGDAPWKLSSDGIPFLNLPEGGLLDRVVGAFPDAQLDLEQFTEATGSSRGTRPAAPPSITLRLDNRSGASVFVAAVGPGAIAWTQAQRTLRGATWTRNEKGAPVVTVEDAPDLVAAVRRAHAEVTLDLRDYTPPGEPRRPATPAAPEAERPPGPKTPPTDTKFAAGKAKTTVTASTPAAAATPAPAPEGKVTRTPAAVATPAPAPEGEVSSLRLKSSGDQVVLLATGVTPAWAEARKTLLGQSWTSAPEGMAVTFVDRPDLLRDLDAALAALHVGELPTLDIGEYTHRHITLQVEKVGKSAIVAVLGASNQTWAKYHPHIIGEVQWGTKTPTQGRTKFGIAKEGVPFALVRDYPSLADDLARQFPGVNLDFEHYHAGTRRQREAPAKTTAAPEPELVQPQTKEGKKTHESKGKSKKTARKGSRQLKPGAGPGELQWDEVVDEGLRGLAAPLRHAQDMSQPEGRLMILRAAPGAYALFLHYTKGGFEQIACGPKVDDLKREAAAYVQRNRPMTVAEHLAQSPCAARATDEHKEEPAPKEPAPAFKEPRPEPDSKTTSHTSDHKKEKAMQEPEKRDEDEKDEKELLMSLRDEIKSGLAEEEDD